MRRVRSSEQDEFGVIADYRYQVNKGTAFDALLHLQE